MSNSDYKQCPCGSGVSYEKCCEPYLMGRELAPTAEALMRSRYTAYVCLDNRYLQQTWHFSTRPKEIDASTQQWIGLKILNTRDGGRDDKAGQVEFEARYKVNGRAHRMHETSEFIQVEGRWFYIGGLVSD